jgi:hypothetical protein
LEKFKDDVYKDIDLNNKPSHNLLKNKKIKNVKSKVTAIATGKTFEK